MIGHHALIGAVSRVAVAAVTTPADRYGAALLTWNPDTNLAGSAGDPVSAWTDEVYGFASATAAGGARPVLRVESNGLRWAEFDGIDDFMTFAGNPSGAVANTIDVVGVTICGLIKIGDQPLFSAGVYAGAVFGGPVGVQLHSGFSGDELIGLNMIHSAFGSAAAEFRMGNNPYSWQGGTSAVPVVPPTTRTFQTAGEVIPKGQWLPYVLHLPATAAARLMIGNRANVVAQATGAQNLPVPVKYLGARWNTATSAVDLRFKGGVGPFFAVLASAMDDAAIDWAFDYLAAKVPA